MGLFAEAAFQAPTRHSLGQCTLWIIQPPFQGTPATRAPVQHSISIRCIVCSLYDVIVGLNWHLALDDGWEPAAGLRHLQHFCPRTLHCIQDYIYKLLHDERIALKSSKR